jgi:hypothetical protein
MEILNNELLWGSLFFLLGVLTLIQCQSIDVKNHYKLRSLRRLELYGRREVDSRATLPLDFLCSSMTVMGSGIAFYGLIRIFSTLL